FRKTFSSYGASDLEINIGVESELSIALRQAIDAKPQLGRDLYGDGTLPMIFQYDPLNYLIESDRERNLLFTPNRLENVSPRVRYNLHDRGLVKEWSAIQTILQDHGFTLKNRSGLPLLFHW